MGIGIRAELTAIESIERRTDESRAQTIALWRWSRQHRPGPLACVSGAGHARDAQRPAGPPDVPAGRISA